MWQRGVCVCCCWPHSETCRVQLVMRLARTLHCILIDSSATLPAPAPVPAPSPPTLSSLGANIVVAESAFYALRGAVEQAKLNLNR